MKRIAYAASALCAAALTAGVARAAPADGALRVYYVGNSVTDTIRYRPLAELAAMRGVTLEWGRHMIPGAPLEWLHDHPDDGFREKPYGGWAEALTSFAWDAVSFQPFDRHFWSTNKAGVAVGDVDLIANWSRKAAASRSNSTRTHMTPPSPATATTCRSWTRGSRAGRRGTTRPRA